MSVLSATEIQHGLQSIPDWKLVQQEIVRTFEFPDFVRALRFVNQVGEKAESQGHHPDIDIRYNKVRMALTSHDANGLTDKDFVLARSCDIAFKATQ